MTKIPQKSYPWIEYQYSNSKLCMLYYFSGHMLQVGHVRLDNVLDRGYFPHVLLDVTKSSATQMNSVADEDEAHAPVQDTINDPELLKKTQEIHDYLYSFKPKTCDL